MSEAPAPPASAALSQTPQAPPLAEPEQNPPGTVQPGRKERALPPLLRAAKEAMRDRDVQRGLALVSRSLVQEGESGGEGLAVMGYALREANMPHAALECMRSATMRYSAHAGVLFQHAMAAHDLGLLDEARQAFERTAKVLPSHPEVHMGLADVLLMQGNWKRGWDEHEWRYGTTAGQKILNQFDNATRWMGGSIKSKRLLVYGEQGYGDTLQFARLLPLARQRCKSLLLGCSPDLHRLFQGIPGADAVTARLPAKDQYDVHTPITSLGRLLGITPETLPAKVPYLEPDAELVAKWRARLGQTQGPRIAISWAGRPTHPRNHRRSMPLQGFEPLAPHGPFYSVSPLRYSQADLNDAQSKLRIREFGKRLHNFADTAALLTQLDLLISVDTSVAHLAGALGRPVWLLVPFTPDWRWTFGREDSIWYPSMRLFRQPMPGDWASVMKEVSAALGAWKAGWRSTRW